MKLFIKTLLYFLLPFIILSYPLDYILSSILRQSNNYPGEFEVWNTIYDANANCDIAIYGSSRAWVHIDPKIVQDTLGLKTLNFGIDGHNFWLQYLRHIELLKYNKQPKIIILSVDIFSLQKRKDLYQSEQFLPYMLWNSNIKDFTNTYVGYKKSDYYIPFIRYLGKTKSFDNIMDVIVNKKASNFRNNGYLGKDEIWNDDFEKAKSEFESYTIHLDKTSINLFEEFIIQCKNKKIELIFTYTPEYIEGQKFVKNRDEIIRLLHQFSNQYSIPYFDYSKDSICFDKQYFYNATHLNKKGAEIFSRKLASDIKNKLYFSQ